MIQVDGKHSSWTHVDSGISQGTVLSPLLFPLHINDLPKSVSSHVRLFTDYCLLYRANKSVQCQTDFQKYIDEWQIWVDKWSIKFNASKCQIMQIHRSTKSLEIFYTINKKVLAQVEMAKYVAVIITEELYWCPHLNNSVTKTNKCLESIKRNITNWA